MTGTRDRIFAELLDTPNSEVDNAIVKIGVEALTTWWNWEHHSYQGPIVFHNVRTGTVTRCNDMLLTTIFTAYKTLKATRATVSLVPSCAGTNRPVSSNTNPPIDPDSACRAVRVYGNGNRSNTPLLNIVKPRLKVKYSASQNIWES
jgi:hypothetical protein